MLSTFLAFNSSNDIILSTLLYSYPDAHLHSNKVLQSAAEGSSGVCQSFVFPPHERGQHPFVIQMTRTE